MNLASLKTTSNAEGKLFFVHNFIKNMLYSISSKNCFSNGFLGFDTEMYVIGL